MASPPAKVSFYRPGKAFPAISVTGKECALGCDYCQGHYLEGMLPVRSGDELRRLASVLESRGAKGFLLSGGCDVRGRVPLGPFLEAVSEIKRTTSLLVNVHTGLLDREEEAERLVRSGVDCLSVDIVQDPEVIHRVMHLEGGPEDYRRTLELLFSAGARRVVPHICIGLAGDSTHGEEKALRLISRFLVSAVVLLSFLPAPGTPMGTAERPGAEHVLRIARVAMGSVSAPILMGCMRPRGDWQLEIELIKSGVRGMAMPSPRTVEWAKGIGLEVEWREECCAFQR